MIKTQGTDYFPRMEIRGRIGLFGGTFDPPHWGHIKIAIYAADELDLEQLAFIPALHPPHKPRQSCTSFDMRCQMLELCLPQDPRFRLCLVEREKNLPGTTLETILELRKMGYEEEYCHLIWLMGSDSLLELDSWHKPEELLSEVEVAVFPRPGFSAESAEERFRRQVKILHTPRINLASHDIRAHRLSLQESVPAAVAQFILKNKLYDFEI